MQAGTSHAGWLTNRSALINAALSPRAWSLITLAIALSGVTLATLGLAKVWIPVCLVLGVAIVFALPISWAIFGYFAYLLVDGALKVNSNYHPVVHVAQDLLLISLVLRSAFDGGEGLRKFIHFPLNRFFLLFFVWLMIQYVNPFGLGLLPSVAGTKVYVSMMALFLLVYHHFTREQVDKLFLFIVVLATIESGLAVVEYLYGQEFVYSLHPRYAIISRMRFVGLLFRPFGTTNVPGGPAVWIFLTAPMAAYLLMAPGKAILVRSMAAIFMGVAIPALIYCQIRTAIVLSLLGILLVVFFPGRGFLKRVLLIGGAGAVAVGIAMSYLGGIFEESPQVRTPHGSVNAEQAEHLRSRFTSLGDAEMVMSARHGAFDAILALARETVLGIGLSRVGAASSPWQSRIRADPYFGPNWSFADNLYRAIFTELGLFGLFSWLLMVGAVIGRVFKAALSGGSRGNRLLMWCCASSVVVLLIGGYGSEGVLYAPVSTFFWLYMAVGLKEAEYAKQV